MNRLKDYIKDGGLRRLLKSTFVVALPFLLFAGYQYWTTPEPACLSEQPVQASWFGRPACTLNDQDLYQYLASADGQRKSHKIKEMFWHYQGLPLRVVMENGAVSDVYFGDSKLLDDTREQIRQQGFVLKTLEPVQPGIPFAQILINVLPILFVIAAWFLYQKGYLKPGFGKSVAKMFTNTGKISFADVAGYSGVKKDLEETVAYLKDPAKLEATGGRVPRGILLIGPPGTGKTLLARAVAGEAGVPFFSISGSGFVEMFVGVGASRVRDTFERARKEAKRHAGTFNKKQAVAIIFVDEIDSVGRHRGAGIGGGNDEREQTLNQLLAEMDGFDKSDEVKIIVIAATNRPDVLDPALLRPGRFDRQILVPNPDLTDREQILAYYFAKVKMAEEANAKHWAKRTTGMSPADLGNLVNEAALLAARKQTLIDNDRLGEALDKIQMGAERSFVMTKKERHKTAEHEAGHVICGIYGGFDKYLPVSRTSIVARTWSLGVAIWSYLRDPVSQEFGEVLSFLIMVQGGREAELLAAEGDVTRVTSGAANDILKATEMATKAVSKDGFGVFVDERLVPRAYDTSSPDPFLGKTVATANGAAQLSQLTLRWVDHAVDRLVRDGAKQAAAILRRHQDEWQALAKRLTEEETLDREQIFKIVNQCRVTKDLEPLPSDNVEDP